MATIHQVPIAFTLDTICPFTYLARRKLRLAIDEATQDLKLPLDFKVEYKPYQLDPKLPKEGTDKWEWYLKKNNGDEAAMNGMVKHMTKLCKEVGINLSYRGIVANTLDAHRLIKWTQINDKPKTEALMDNLYRLYFEEEKHPSSKETLLEAARFAGLDMAKVEKFVDSDELEEETKEDIQEQGINGIDAVPSVNIEGKRRDFTLQGAKDVQVYVNTFQQLLKELS